MIHKSKDLVVWGVFLNPPRALWEGKRIKSPPIHLMLRFRITWTRYCLTNSESNKIYKIAFYILCSFSPKIHTKSVDANNAIKIKYELLIKKKPSFFLIYIFYFPSELPLLFRYLIYVHMNAKVRGSCHRCHHCHRNRNRCCYLLKMWHGIRMKRKNDVSERQKVREWASKMTRK